MRHQSNLYCYRALNFGQSAYPFVSWSRAMEALRQVMLRKQQQNTKRGNQSDVFALMMVNGGFIS